MQSRVLRRVLLSTAMRTVRRSHDHPQNHPSPVFEFLQNHPSPVLNLRSMAPDPHKKTHPTTCGATGAHHLLRQYHHPSGGFTPISSAKVCPQRSATPYISQITCGGNTTTLQAGLLQSQASKFVTGVQQHPPSPTQAALAVATSPGTCRYCLLRMNCSNLSAGIGLLR